MATPRIADQVGRVLGDRYRLVRPLGIGASAHVFVAEDVRLRRRVAIKVLHPALAGDAAFLRRFRAEAQVVAALRHPNIVTVFDWGDEDGAPYLVMELLEGGSLRTLLDRGPRLSLAQAAAVGAAAARALAHAHHRGLVHRDIKPANLLFDDTGRLTVADFGLARALAEATWTEPAGAVVGTARYAAPEQVRGQALDSRADVYALAVVLVEATTGTVPFAADTTLGTLMARVEQPLPVPAELGPLAAVLQAAGTVDPARRLDAEGLARALDGLAAKVGPPAPLPLAPPTGPPDPGRQVDPTEIPGRPRVFDVDALDEGRGAADAVSRPAPPRPAPAGAPAPTRPVPDGSRGDAAGSSMGAPAGAARAGAAGSARGPAASALAPGSPGMAGGRAGESKHLGEPGAGWPGDEGRPPDGPTRGGPPRRWRRRLVALVVVLALLGGGAVAVAETTDLFVPSHPVPVVVGQQEPTAARVLARLHLHLVVGGRAYDAKAPAGQVLSQRPARGDLHEGASVSVVVSRGPQPVKVPSLLSLTQSDAAAVLQTLGLKLGTVTPHSSMTVPKGEIISSDPAHGTLLPGQSVAIVVSTGKPTVVVPTLQGPPGASFAAAQAALQALGLGATEAQDYSDTVPKGAVIKTQPAAGTTVVVGTTVSVVTSLGPHLATVPPVQGESVTGATQTLTNAGFTVSGVQGNPTATVTGTAPGAGAVVHWGSAVQIITG